VAPGQLAHSLWANWAFGPGGSHLAHVLDVAARKSAHIRVSRPQVIREPVDDPRTPALGALPVQDGLAYAPVQLDKSGVDHTRSRPLRRTDLGLQLSQQMWVVVGQRQLGASVVYSMAGVSPSTCLANPKINLKPSRRKHVDQRVNAEQVDLPPHEVGDPGLRDTELLCRRALRQACPDDVGGQLLHERRADLQVLGLATRVFESVPHAGIPLDGHGVSLP